MDPVGIANRVFLYPRPSLLCFCRNYRKNGSSVNYGRYLAVFVQILFRYVVFWDFVSADFFLLIVAGVLDPGHGISFESIALFDQFLDAFRIGAFDIA